MSEEKTFGQDTEVRHISGSIWEGFITPAWNIGKAPNGGYLMAVAARAMASALDHKDPLTITGYYLNRAENSDARFDVEVIRQGRSVSTAQTSLVQEGEEKVRFIAAYTDFSSMKGETWSEEPMPDIPGPEECAYDDQMPVAINDVVDIRFTPEHQRWMHGELGEFSEMKGWIRLKSNEEPDLFSLVLFADACPPPVFNRIGIRGWVPTIELTVHLRDIPRAGFIAFRYRTRHVIKGTLETDVELWDEDRKLVAMARQIQKLRLPEHAVPVDKLG